MKQVKFLDKQNEDVHAGILTDEGNIICMCCGGLIEADETGKGDEFDYEILEEYPEWVNMDPAITSLDIIGKIRFQDIRLTGLEMSDETSGSYLVPATDELIDIVNKIRKEKGYTDLVEVTNDNDVYYCFYLCFNGTEKEFSLNAEVAHGEHDDFTWYEIELSQKEKKMLTWKLISQLSTDIWNG